MSLKLKMDTAESDRKTAPKQFEKRAFADESAEQAASTERAASAGEPRRILVVDDNQVVLKAFEMKLKTSGFSVTTTTECGGAARLAQQIRAELIIMDINFSGGGSGAQWNGFTVMQWMRRFPELEKVPIIIITGGNAAVYKDKAFSAGAFAFFEKPVPYSALLAEISRALNTELCTAPAS
jgi:two-component system cell cycle response regulator DivK